MQKLIFLWLFGTIAISLNAQNIPIPPKPEPARFVNDFGGLMNPQQVEILEKRLKTLDDSTSTQIVIATINSLQGFGIKEFSNEWFRNWGIGQKGKNNGMLILMSRMDKKVRFEVGYGLEGVMTDAISVKIQQEKMIPFFKEGNYYQGFVNALDEIIPRVKGEFIQEKDERSNRQASAKNQEEFWIDYVLSWIILSVVLGIFFALFLSFISSTPYKVILFVLSLQPVLAWHYFLLSSHFMLSNTRNVMLVVVIDLAIHFFLFYLVGGLDNKRNKKAKTYSSRSKYSSGYSDSSSSTTFIGGSSYSDYSDYKDYSDYSDSSSSYSDSYSDSSFGGGDSGGGGGDSSW